MRPLFTETDKNNTLLESFLSHYFESSEDDRFESWLKAKQAEGKYTKQKHYFAKSKGYTDLDFDDWCKAGFEKYGKDWKTPEPEQPYTNGYDYSEWDLALYAAYLEIKPFWEEYIEVCDECTDITPYSSDWYYREFWFDYTSDDSSASKHYRDYADDNERMEKYIKPQVEAKQKLLSTLESLGYGPEDYRDKDGFKTARYGFEHDWNNPSKCCFVLRCHKKSKLKELLEVGKNNQECIAFAKAQEEKRCENKKKAYQYTIDFDSKSEYLEESVKIEETAQSEFDRAKEFDKYVTKEYLDGIRPKYYIGALFKKYSNADEYERFFRWGGFRNYEANELDFIDQLTTQEKYKLNKALAAQRDYDKALFGLYHRGSIPQMTDFDWAPELD